MSEGVESMTDVQRLALWMQNARRLRIIADLAEKLLLLIGCLALAVGVFLLVDQQLVTGALTAAVGMIVAILGPLLGALGQNQAAINECHCRMLDEMKKRD